MMSIPREPEEIIEVLTSSADLSYKQFWGWTLTLSSWRGCTKEMMPVPGKREEMLGEERNDANSL